jgi:hypothetical protein
MSLEAEISYVKIMEKILNSIKYAAIYELIK